MSGSGQAEQALLRTAIESLDENFALYDADDRIVLFNRRFAETMRGLPYPGQRHEDLLRALLALGGFPDAAGREEAWLAERTAARRAGRGPHEIRYGERWFLVRDHRAPDGSTITVGTDITARKRAERAIAENEARLRETFEQAAVGIGVRSLEGRWIEVNQRLCEILGYTRDELLATSSVAITPADDRERTVDYNRRLASGELVSYAREKQYIRKDGSRVWVHLSLAVLAAADGAPDRVVSIVQDISARRAAEEAARAAEERLRAGLENLGEMIVLTDAEDRIVIANRRFVEFNRQVAEHARPGCHYSEHLRAGIALGMFPDAVGREEAWLAERMAIRHRGGGPVERRRQDGRWLLVDDQPLPDGGIVSYGIEITARKQAEEAAHRAHERLRLALESSRVALWDHDLPGNEVYLSAEWAMLLGGPPAATIGSREDMGRLAHPDELAKVQAAFRDAISGKRAEFAIEHRVAARNGDWRWMFSRGRVTQRDSRGRALRMIGTSIDITERKDAEAALVESEARLRSLVSLSNDVFWETDDAHRFVSQVYSRIAVTQPAPEPEIGLTRWEVPYTAPDEEAWRRHRADLDARRVFRDFELARPVPGDGERVIQISGEPVFDARGEFRGYRGVGKDITAHRQAENALRALNADLERRVAERTAALETAYRELEAFSYSVSHDLRAPLRAIAGFSNILREDEGERLSEDGRRLLATIDQSAQQMGRLTDALLGLARTSRHTLAHGALDMATIANQVAGELAHDYPGAWIEIRALPPAAGDATLVRQVFANLIGNALKYSARAASPRIEVGSETLAGDAVYFVRDNGVGFDMAYAERLFKPFERLHPDQQFKGAGIGLALANLIVQRHGGRIWAEGAPGRGAIFRFVLRRAGSA